MRVVFKRKVKRVKEREEERGVSKRGVRKERRSRRGFKKKGKGERHKGPKGP